MKSQFRGSWGSVALALACMSAPALPVYAQVRNWLADEAAVSVAKGAKASWKIAGEAGDVANLFVVAKSAGNAIRIDLTPAISVEAGQLQIDLGLVGLPVGKYELEISAISGTGQLDVVARTAMAVTAGGDAPEAAAAAGGSIEPATNRSEFKPKLELGVRGQALERRNAAAGPSPRQSYADLTLEGGLETLNSGEDWELKSNFAFTGSSFPGDTPQFGTKGSKASKIDLTNYLVEGGYRDTRFSAGNINVSTHPLLVQGISNRGISVSSRVPVGVDVNASIQNGGGPQVGVENLLGVAQANNLFRQFGAGFDADPEHPGKARFDITRVQAAQYIGQLTTGGAAVEKSDGVGLRFSGRNSDSRGRVEVSVATSRHTPAGDPVPPANKGYAWTAEAGYDIVKDWAVRPDMPVSFNTAVRAEHSSPQYRSLGSPYGANYRQLVGLFNLKTGPGLLQGQVVRRYDNVGEDHLYIRNKLHSWSLNGSYPLDQMVMAWLGKPAAAAPSAPAQAPVPAAESKPDEAKPADAKTEEAKAETPKVEEAKPNPWWPTLTYSRKSVHGFGSPDFIPVGYTIDDLPDVVVNEQAWGLRWSFDKAQFGVKRATINQDNRQIGFTNEGVQDTRWGYALDYKATDNLTVGASHDLSSNLRFVSGVIAEGFQSKLSMNWAATPDSTLLLELNRNMTRDTALAFSVQRGLQVQYTRKFKTPGWGGESGLPSQFYLRLLGANGITGAGLSPRSYALQFGVTVSFF